MIVELLSVPVDPELCYESGINYGQIQGGDSCGTLMAGHVYNLLVISRCVCYMGRVPQDQGLCWSCCAF